MRKVEAQAAAAITPSKHTHRSSPPEEGGRCETLLGIPPITPTAAAAPAAQAGKMNSTLEVESLLEEEVELEAIDQVEKEVESCPNPNPSMSPQVAKSFNKVEYSRKESEIEVKVEMRLS